MAYVGAASAVVSLLGTVAQASAQSEAADARRNEGIAQQQAADYQAKLMEIKAGQDQAVAQRQAIDQRRKEQLVLSRAQAMAAASGAGAADPSVISNDERTTRDGELGALTALYNGDEQASELNDNATLTRFKGDEAYANANALADSQDTGAIGTALHGIGESGSLFAKYGAEIKTSTNASEGDV